MKFRYEAKRGGRFRSKYLCIRAKDLWWSDEHQRWGTLHDVGTEGGSNAYPCRTIRAFERHLRKHPELGSATLVHRYAGQDVEYIR